MYTLFINDFGYSFVSFIVPIGFILVFGIIIVQTIFALSRWSKNNHSPRLSVQAKIVDKRSDVSIRHSGNDAMTHSSTTYYVSFEFKSGDRLELKVPVNDFGYLVVGDDGILEFQGTRFISFNRN